MSGVVAAGGVLGGHMENNNNNNNNNNDDGRVVLEEGHCPWEESEAEPEEIVLDLTAQAVAAAPVLPQLLKATPTTAAKKNTNNKAVLVEPQIILSTEVISALSKEQRATKPSLMQRAMAHFRSYRELWKTNLSVLVVTTTAIGWISSGGSIVSKSLFALVCGTFLQSACANSINQMMEVEQDKIMMRTKKRPLPTGRISKLHAGIQAAVLGLTGTATLYHFINPITAALGAVNIVLYTCLYTPLKRKHWLNTWVGTVNGCLPPVMGYTAINASLSDNATLATFLFASLYAWQIPHFMAISYKCGHDYEKAGFKMLSNKDPKHAAWAAVTHSLLMMVLCAVVAKKREAAWFLVTSLPINFSMQLYPSLRFLMDRNYDSATVLFWGSLFHLPSLFLPIVARGLVRSSQFLSA
eukprot:TRINITY_DN12978_c0_g1_i1.p1 TRINITY_DN12978_c0_g1~~TRINITY_DN12978_c0_g1_i1.p1  ORF type:complete len:419 (-),score=104.71 TRINITY_DN12978_c0_g1_i1:107-1339(-)